MIPLYKKTWVIFFLLLCTFGIHAQNDVPGYKGELVYKAYAKERATFLDSLFRAKPFVCYSEEFCDDFFSYIRNYYLTNEIRNNTLDFSVFIPYGPACGGIAWRYYIAEIDSTFFNNPPDFSNKKIVYYKYGDAIYTNFINSLPRDSLMAFIMRKPSWLDRRPQKYSLPNNFWEFKNIQHLELAIDTLSDKISNFKTLKKLRLSITDVFFSPTIWAGFINLKELELSSLLRLKIVDFEGAANIPVLKKIIVKDVAMDTEFEDNRDFNDKIIFSFSKQKELRVIDFNIVFLDLLRAAPLYFTMLDIAQKTKSFPSLDSLTFNTIKADTLGFDLKNFSKLSYLNLSENYIFKALFFKHLKKNKLRELRLHDSQIVAFPLDICELKKLEILDLSNNKITTLPKKLKKLKKLKTLNLNNNPIPDSDIEALRKAMPWCEVIF